MRFRPDHWLLVEDGRIAGTQPASQPLAPDWQPGAHCVHHDHRGQLLMPGFIDTHVHSPQLDVIASYGTELLDWLNTYTFPAEQRYADPAVAAEGAALFCDALLASGTTSAVVFPTVHKVSAEALFSAAQPRGMRLVDRQGADGPPRARRPARRRGPGRARLHRPDRPLARPRPQCLCRHGAFRRHQHA